MDIERVKIIAELLQRAIKVEELRSPAAFAAFGSGLSPDERKTVLDGRAAKIETELRDAGFAILKPVAPAPPKSAALTAAVIPGAAYETAKALLNDTKDPCAEARRAPA